MFHFIIFKSNIVNCIRFCNNFYALDFVIIFQKRKKKCYLLRIFLLYLLKSYIPLVISSSISKINILSFRILCCCNRINIFYCSSFYWYKNMKAFFLELGVYNMKQVKKEIGIFFAVSYSNCKIDYLFWPIPVYIYQGSGKPEK